MASLSFNSNGFARLMYMGDANTRKTIYLGKMPKKAAFEFLRNVEHLIFAKESNTTPEREVAKWAANLSSKYREKLVHHELLERPTDLVVKRKITYRLFVGEYIAKRGRSKKRSTILNWRQALDGFADSMPKNIAVNEVTEGHAMDWLDGMQEKQNKGEFAASTIHKRVQICKTAFDYLVKHKTIEKNPFAEIHLRKPKPKNNVEVSQELVKKIMQHAPPRLRAALVLARWAGMRCPSEVLSLRWEHVDFENGKLTIPQPKTEHHGKAYRECPLFPEIRKELTSLERIDEFVVPVTAGSRKSDRESIIRSNLRKGLTDLLESIGVEPWPRLFASLRASRQTELEERFGLPAACAWLGNSERVAMESYLLVFEDKWKEAIDDAKNDAVRANQTNSKPSRKKKTQ